MQKKYSPHKIAYKLNKKGVDLEEAIEIEDLLLKMLAFVPGRRRRKE